MQTTEQKTAQDIEMINQRICSELVRREVIHCASSMMSELLEISSDTNFDTFSYDDLFEICTQEDWENPAREALEIIEDSAGNEYAFPKDHTVFVSRIGLTSEFHPDCWSAWDWFEGNRDIELPDNWDWESTGKHHNDIESIDCVVESYPIDGLEDELSDDYLEIHGMPCDDWQEVCEEFELDPYQCEALEHWIVTNWFASVLADHGELTGEIFDFHIWGRTCSGQSISQDGIIREIANELEILHGQKNSWE